MFSACNHTSCRFQCLADVVGNITGAASPWKAGYEVAGKPLPKMLVLTPTTVPVLKTVLIAHLEWSPKWVRKTEARCFQIFLKCMTRVWRLRSCFEIGIVGSRTKIAPLTHHRIAKVAIVCLIGIGLENHILYFTPYFATRSERGIGINFSTHLHHRKLAHGKGPSDKAAFHDKGIFSNVNGPFFCIKNGGMNLCTLFHKMGCLPMMVLPLPTGKEVLPAVKAR